MDALILVAKEMHDGYGSCGVEEGEVGCNDEVDKDETGEEGCFDL